MEQRLEAIRDMKYEVQETMINNNVEYEIVGVCVLTWQGRKWKVVVSLLID